MQWHHSKGTTWSEVSPLPYFSIESLDEAESQLNQFLKSNLLQLKKCSDLQSLNALINGKLYPSIHFGLEMGFIKITQFNPTTIDKAPSIAGLIAGEFVEIKRYDEYPVIKVKVGRQSLKDDINNINNILQHID